MKVKFVLPTNSMNVIKEVWLNVEMLPRIGDTITFSVSVSAKEKLDLSWLLVKEIHHRITEKEQEITIIMER